MQCAYCVNEKNSINEVFLPCFHFVCDDCCDFKTDRCPQCSIMIEKIEEINKFIEEETEYQDICEEIINQKIEFNKKLNDDINDEIQKVNQEEREEERKLLEEYNQKVILLKKKTNLSTNKLNSKLSENLKKKQSLNSMNEFLRYCKEIDKKINKKFFDVLNSKEY